jgi:hypothetical protein
VIVLGCTFKSMEGKIPPSYLGIYYLEIYFK